MEAGLPMLNCLLQHTLRNLCSHSESSSSSSSSKWVYAVFWRIVPRNYPPPKWDYGGSALDRSKGNKRNWILVWEDGFCDFHECERVGTGSGYMKGGMFGADIFFKMSHEVYNYGEGLVGKIAADNSHKWVYKETPNENDPNFISSWNMSIDPQPRAWEFQFNSGIQTIAIISVREGIIQLGSLDKVVEDLNLVISIQRKLSYLHTIPGVFTIQRSYLPIQQHPYIFKPNNETTTTTTTKTFCLDDKRRTKRLINDNNNERPEDSPMKSVNLGWNTPRNGTAMGSSLPFLSIPPHLPTMSCSLGALLSKLPSVIPSYNTIEAPDIALINNMTKKTDNGGAALAEGPIAETNAEAAQEEKKSSPVKASNLVLHEGSAVQLGFGPLRDSSGA